MIAFLESEIKEDKMQLIAFRLLHADMNFDNGAPCKLELARCLQVAMESAVFC